MPSSSPPRALARALAAGAGLAFVATCAASPALAAPTAASLTLTAPATAQVGDALDLTIDVAGTTDVYAYEVTLTHDPALLTYVDATTTAPEGGFDSVTSADGTVTVVHTRLGTSPALEGDLPVGTVALTAAAAGTATISATVELVGADGETLELSAAVPAVVTITALPEPEPTQEPTPGPTDDPTTPPTDEPTDDPTTSPTDTSPTSDPTPSSSATDGGSRGPLASTGAQVGTLAAVAALAVAAGVFLLRRRAVSHR